MINKPHLPKKNGPRHYAKSPTAQDMCITKDISGEKELKDFLRKRRKGGKMNTQFVGRTSSQ